VLIRGRRWVVPERLGGVDLSEKIGWRGSGNIVPGLRKDEVEFERTPWEVGVRQSEDLD
jgi:hypothetical protein